MQFDTIFKDKSHIAPDGSEIRELVRGNHGGLCHCTLPPGAVSEAVKHKTVEEIWYCLEGGGEMWRKTHDEERTDSIFPGVSLDIPPGAHFQFRNTGSIPLRLIVVTMPNWPGNEEAVTIEGLWPQ